MPLYPFIKVRICPVEIFLQVTFLVECIAPRTLHIDRYLPVTPIPLWLNHTGEVIEEPSFGSAKVNNSPDTDQILGNSGIKRIIKKLVRSGEAHMHQVKENMVQESTIGMERELQSEISRLQNLARPQPHRLINRNQKLTNPPNRTGGEPSPKLDFRDWIPSTSWLWRID